MDQARSTISKIVSIASYFYFFYYKLEYVLFFEPVKQIIVQQ